MSFSVEKLTGAHDATAFDCGQPELNQWLRRFALVNQAANAATTFVACLAGTKAVVGYYALAAGAVDHREAPRRATAGLARHPIPVVILARLAVDRREAGQGLGAALLKDALLRVNNAADEIGIRAVLVHAKSPEARRFYERYDFEPSPIDDLQLFLLLKDVRRIVRG
ncbi:MAG: GNAT family N-acetyltransferase [Chloroflexota bacterium]|nr:GNAT family N-acetyltransferase [Chloroflexota bacterium]